MNLLKLVAPMRRADKMGAECQERELILRYVLPDFLSISEKIFENPIFFELRKL